MKSASNEMKDDLSIINASQAGDAAAFRELVRRYENTVYSFAFKVCRNREKAEETLQDTFVNVYRKLGQFDGRSKFTTWLYRIVTNNCFMLNRKRKIDEQSVPIGNGSGEVSELRQVDAGPLERIIGQELADALDAAILRLPLDYRLAFVLRDIEGLTTDESAEVLDISPAAVKSRLHRARAFLRDQLSGYIM
jgi:RNA polymerase sigma-70 factor, ECF subfamily